MKVYTCIVCGEMQPKQWLIDRHVARGGCNRRLDAERMRFYKESQEK